MPDESGEGTVMREDLELTDSVEEYVARVRHRTGWMQVFSVAMLAALLAVATTWGGVLWMLLPTPVVFTLLAFLDGRTHRPRDPAPQRHRVRSEVVNGQPVTRVDYDRPMMLGRKLAWAAMLLASYTLLPLAAIMNAVQVAVVVLLSLASTVMLPLVLRRHRTHGYLLVGAWGIYVEGPTSTCSMAWADVRSIRLATRRDHPPMLEISSCGAAGSWTGTTVTRLTSIPVTSGTIMIETGLLNPFITPVLQALRSSIASPAAQARFATDEGVRLLRGEAMMGERQL